jgi:hypothetical protein
MTRATITSVAALALTISLAGCGVNGSPVGRRSSDPAWASAAGASHDVLFYGVAASTNPDVGAPGTGIGVVDGLLTGHPRVVARSDRWVAVPDGQWLPGNRLLANRRANTRSTGADETVEVGARGLALVGALSESFPRSWASFVSPNGQLLGATQGIPAGANGLLRPGPLTAVSSLTGQNKRVLKLGGPLLGWVGANRLAFLRRDRLQLFDLSSNMATDVVSLAQLARDAGALKASIPPSVSTQQLAGSPDGRFVAFPLELTYAAPNSLRRGGVIAIVAVADHTVRIVRSRLEISMFSFAPSGDRFAYSTSGFPEPHELWVTSRIDAPAKRLFITTGDHFDWIAWSPDAKWILVDDQLSAPTPAWRLIPSDGQGRSRTTPRLGGRPLWCCAPLTSFGQ